MMLKKQPTERPSIVELLSHKWISQYREVIDGEVLKEIVGNLEMY